MRELLLCGKFVWILCQFGLRFVLNYWGSIYEVIQVLRKQQYGGAVFV